MESLVCIAIMAIMIVVVGCWLINDNDKYKDKKRRL